MHSTVLSAINFLHVEKPPVIVRELVRLMREPSEMSAEFGHGRSLWVLWQLSPLAIIGVGGCQSTVPCW